MFYLVLWCRKLAIILTQLHFWIYYLFQVGIVSDAYCWCDAALKIVKHFFLHCPIYVQARSTLVCKLNGVTTCYNINIVHGIRPRLLSNTEKKYKETRMFYEIVRWNGIINCIVVDLILRQPKVLDVGKGQIHYLFS